MIRAKTLLKVGFILIELLRFRLHFESIRNWKWIRRSFSIFLRKRFLWKSRSFSLILIIWWGHRISVCDQKMLLEKEAFLVFLYFHRFIEQSAFLFMKEVSYSRWKSSYFFIEQYRTDSRKIDLGENCCLGWASSRRKRKTANRIFFIG